MSLPKTETPLPVTDDGSNHSTDRTNLSAAYREALAAHERGWSVIPVDPKSKKPRVRWRQYQQRQATTQEIESWRDEKAFAVVTGKLSGIVVLDLDPGADLGKRETGVTPVASTPRKGWHYYYKHPEKHIRTRANALPNVDIRADGGYAVLPGSSGRQWHIHPDEEDLAELPEWFSDLTPRAPLNTEHICTKFKAKSIPEIAPNDLSREGLFDLVDGPEVGREIAGLVGIPEECVPVYTDRGKSFPCVLPGHEETNASASLLKHSKTGGLMYRDWHAKSGYEWYFMPEVFASGYYGKAVKLRPAEYVVWQIRALIELKHLSPYPVELAPLPDGAAGHIQKVYRGFRLLLGCRWHYKPYEPAPFARNFASAWCGVGRNKVGEAINLLQMKYKLIRIVDQQGHLRLWLPSNMRKEK